MNAVGKSCVDEGFYAANDPAGNPDETRTILIGKLVENELEARIEEQVRNHLKSCSFCTDLLRQLEAPHELNTKILIPYAVCPPSEHLDHYLFNRSSLPTAETERLAAHISECPLCREETGWLRDLESSKVISFKTPARRWMDTISVAAAFVFLVIASALWWKQAQTAEPERQLRALAVVKEPHEIDFQGLDRSSAQLNAKASGLYNEAVAHFRSQDFDRAAGLFQKVLEEHPEHSASLFLLGYSYYKLNQAEKAFELCQRAERIHPHSYERCMTLVHLALKTGHFDRAVMEISALHHENPDHPEIHRMYKTIMSLTRGRTLKM